MIFSSEFDQAVAMMRGRTAGDAQRRAAGAARERTEEMSMVHFLVNWIMDHFRERIWN